MAWDKGLEGGSPAHTFAATKEQVVRSVAGPGSGKSFAIGRRISRLIEEGQDPKKILAITFTRTAAKDLRDDIAKLEVNGSTDVIAHTVHSHALSILMQAQVIEHTGRTPRMILDHEIAPALRDLKDPRFGNIDNKKLLKDQYLAAWATLQTDEAGNVKDPIQEAFQTELIDWMKRHGGMLVGEVIPVAIDYLRNNPASPAIGRYDAILVDEYQDLNKSEQEFIKLVRGDAASLVIVGDDDQSIYGFKFAHPDGIRSVDQLHGAYTDVPFNQCRRCPKTVTRMASSLIAKNPNRTLGELIPFDGNQDGIVDIVQWKSVDNEIKGIPQVVARAIADAKLEPADVLILTPRRLIGYQLRDELNKLDIPTRSYFRESSIKKKTAQITYSQLVLAAFPNDLVSLRFLLGAGGSNYRAPQYALLEQYASANKISIIDAINAAADKAIKITGVTTLVSAYHTLRDQMDAVRKQMESDPEKLFESCFPTDDESKVDLFELSEIYSDILSETEPYSGTTPDEFSVWLSDFVGTFQKEVANPEIPEDIDHVRIMSLHSSKGLSSKLVVVASQIDELIPGKDETARHIEEQRRLFYVAITRCKASEDYPGRLIISSFLELPGNLAVQMGIPAKSNRPRKVRATRYLNDFSNVAPKPKRGETLLD